MRVRALPTSICRMELTAIPDIPLSSGAEIPQLGYGVWQIPDDEAEQAVTRAIEVGYRSIDTAMVYGNEAGVGRAVRASDVPRDELFVTTKIWNTDQGADTTRPAFERSLGLLGLDYVDLYLIHWPAAQNDRYLDTWRVMEQLVEEGLVRSIGVSNFEVPHLERLLAECDVPPALNQVELHPYLHQRTLRAFHAQQEIVTEAWSPLGQAAVLDDPTLAGIAAKHGVSAAQVTLRWHLQLGIVAIPKSANPGRIAENIDLFGFELDAEDLAAIDTLDREERVGSHPDDVS
ncbi:MAG: aldo/keto reductase family oxidoreductase [Thermoleophilia bacterium]|nr:aldo/keto reductase family oxidoreductase [Thermoleophilia bacterium]